MLNEYPALHTSSPSVVDLAGQTSETVVAAGDDDAVVAGEVDDVGLVDEAVVGCVGSTAGAEQTQVAGCVERDPDVHPVRGGADEMVSLVPASEGPVAVQHQVEVAGAEVRSAPQVLDVQQVQRPIGLRHDFAPITVDACPLPAPHILRYRSGVTLPLDQSRTAGRAASIGPSWPGMTVAPASRSDCRCWRLRSCWSRSKPNDGNAPPSRVRPK